MILQDFLVDWLHNMYLQFLWFQLYRPKEFEILTTPKDLKTKKL